ncbi:SGNH/GDSL hydrolase family protein [Serratia nevei]|uniref:SGNH/GDSL hydrolase family protein n=1 Tax=Serratia nevei TaxID=2703794 RepID=UPI002862AA3D|nr:SGNH/GDSL hydrolase family protein [Serratia nevei]MDR8479031.1 SGNH/GDSL hydrolase family protein [Serratia nevei]
MTKFLNETSKWEEKIFQLEKDTPVLGGVNGPDNWQAQQLANRTKYLKTSLESIPDYREYTFHATPEDPDGTIAGLAATTSGQTFRVAMGPDSDNSFIYYMNNGGVALIIARAIGSGAIERMLPEYNQQPSDVAGFVDDDGNVPLSFSDGLIDGAGVSKFLVDFIFNNSELFSQVLAYANTYNLSNLLVALFIDDDGNVPFYLNDGDFDTLRCGPDLLHFLQDNLQFQPPVADAAVSDGSSLWRWSSKRALLALLLLAYGKTGWTGDSWTEWPAIAQAMANVLYEKYGKAGDGILQFGIDAGGPGASTGQQMNGIVFKKTGWSIYDASDTTVPPLYGCGPDGMAIFTSGTTATLSYSNLTATSITINYWDVNGAFRYRIDGETWTTVTGSGTNSAKSVVIGGLPLSAHSIDIDTTVNTGTVSLLNLVSKGSGKGTEVNKLGNGAITADGYAKVLPYIAYTAKQLDLDALFMCIGTNDARRGGSLGLFESSLDAWVAAWKSACPDMGIVLVVPSQGNGNYIIPLTDIRDATIRVAKKHSVEWLDFSAFMPSWDKAKAAGMYYDNLHLNDVGANYLAHIACTKFLL